MVQTKANIVAQLCSVTVVLAYLMKKCSMKLFEALHYVKSKRPVACPNNGFLLQLQNFEKVLGGK